MELFDILKSINQVSDYSEKYFLELGTLFPSLLNRESGSSLVNLKKITNSLGEGNDKSSNSEKALFEGYSDKYKPLFEHLNSKIETLTELDKLIAGIKEDSEQMELIALNAMVISIKSGEKGLAFSRITENLQRLSNDMFLFSDKLLEEEKILIENINGLKDIFSNILASQNTLSSKGSTGSSNIQQMITTVVTPLEKMESEISSIYPPIQKAMENLQLQDIIRQALEHIKACLEEINNTAKQVPGSDEELDSICFNIALYDLSVEVLSDIINHLTKSFLEFDNNWSIVTQNLEDIDSQKKNFIYRFLDINSGSTENISSQLSAIINHFKSIMDEFSHYHLVQKDLVHVTQNITEKARTMYTVFGNLRPVMSRLHHVRILQQIEVSKNEAITSVKDSVTDMDNLISTANKSLDTMEVLLSDFIKETTTLLKNFNNSLTADNQNMLNLRKEKGVFFDELQEAHSRVSSIISGFTVFPAGFESKCETVAKDLSGLMDLNLKLKEIKNELTSKKEELSAVRQHLMNEKNVHTWDIRNSKFSEIINRFTITAHKEAAGKIGGFSIEHGAASGDITFF